MTANTTKQTKKPAVDHGQAIATVLLSGFNPTCCYCQQAHSSDNCKIVTKVGARKQILRKSGRCFGCLRKGHISRECRSTCNCSKCGGHHHLSICPRGNFSCQPSLSNSHTTDDSSQVSAPTPESSLNSNAAPQGTAHTPESSLNPSLS